MSLINKLTRVRYPTNISAIICTCCFMGLVIVLLSSWKFSDFFFIDDAQNVFLPFIREMGVIWLSGHIPLLTTNTFWGGNILVDMQTSPFAPQTILTALLSTQFDSFPLLANFLAWLNISLVIIGSYWLGKIFKIRDSYAFLLGFMVATNQIFIYIYCASWWNYASAFAWFVVSFAALLHFQQQQTKHSFSYALLALCCLFVSAGTQMQVAYIVLFILVLGIDYQHYQSSARIINFCLIGLCALLIAAIPVMAEYFVAHDLIERVSSKSNAGNYLVPSWAQILNFFNPYFYTYIHWFNGYQYIPIAMGYVGIIGLLPIFFYRHSEAARSFEFKMLLAAIAVSLLLAFSSSQLGPTRWPFRYLPVTVLLMATLIVYLLNQSTLIFSATRLRYFLWTLGFFALIQLFSSDATVFKGRHILSVIYFIALALLLILPFRHKQKIKTYPFALLCFASFLAWFGGLLQTNTLAGKKLSYPHVSNTVSGSLPKNGYILGLTPAFDAYDKDISDLFSAHPLLFGAKSINGYSPVGHKGFQKLFPSISSHGFFIPWETLPNISRPAEGIPGMYDYQLMNISTIYAWNVDLTPEITTSLTNAGLQGTPLPAKNKVLFQEINPKMPEGSLTYQTVEHSISLDHYDGMQHEWFNVQAVTSERTLIFSRVYWPGYHAFLDNTEYPVVAYKNLLLKVILPANVSGKLHLYYQPVSWQYTKWSMVLGFILLGLIVKLRKFTEPKVTI